jgi:hypothetical protein
LIAGDDGLAPSGGEVVQALRPRLVHRRLQFEGQPLEVLGSGLVILRFEEGQVAQMMDREQRMPTSRVRPGVSPALMDTHPRKGRQDANGARRHAAAAWFAHAGYALPAQAT